MPMRQAGVHVGVVKVASSRPSETAMLPLTLDDLASGFRRDPSNRSPVAAQEEPSRLAQEGTAS